MTPAPHYSNKQLEEAANILNLTAEGLAQILRESTPKAAALPHADQSDMENVVDHADEDNERDGSIGEVCNTNDNDAGQEEIERPSSPPQKLAVNTDIANPSSCLDNHPVATPDFATPEYNYGPGLDFVGQCLSGYDYEQIPIDFALAPWLLHSDLMNTPRTNIQFLQNGEFDDMIDQGAMSTEQEGQSRGDVGQISPKIGDSWQTINPNDLVITRAPAELLPQLLQDHGHAFEGTEALPPLISVTDGQIQATSAMPAYPFLSIGTANSQNQAQGIISTGSPKGQVEINLPPAFDSPSFSEILVGRASQTSATRTSSLAPATGIRTKPPPKLAPKPPARNPVIIPVAQRTASRPKKTPFKTDRIRKETQLTRQVTACVRCRGQRNRCIPDPTNPRGPCLTCQTLTYTVDKMPCLRYKVVDSTLFRTGVDYLAFYRNHPMVGPRYGDFHLNMKWKNKVEKVLAITQDRDSICYLKVREFQPPDEDDAFDLKGRPMYYIPWAIPDADQAAAAMETYLDQSIGFYLHDLLDPSDRLVWDVFHAILNYSHSQRPIKLLNEVLRLWVACRFIEGRWRCCGADNLGSEALKNPFRPEDWVSPPPYIDYQIGSIIMHRVLGPLRQKVLKSLQTLILGNKPENWYIIFLTTFVLLHNYELQMIFQRQYSAKRQAAVRWLDMAVVRATQSGAKTILAHYHICCKGHLPFSPEFDWDAPQNRKMASLNEEQVTTMKKFRNQVEQEADYMKSVNQTDRYEARFWFISQLFEKMWTPRDTLEYSPAV